jgi:hemoglobin
MKTTHKGMGISESDWQAFIGHVDSTLASFEVPTSERTAVLGFVGGIKADIVE